MSRIWLKASRARWLRKLAYRKAALIRSRQDAHKGLVVTDAEAARIHKWEKRIAEAEAQIKRRTAQLNPPAKGAALALAFLREYIGKTEDPPGSNRAPWGLTAWQSAFGPWLVGQAWCGVGHGTALKHAGVQGVTSRVALVSLILADALNGRNGFKSCVYRRSTGHGSVSAGKPGDAIGLFGESTHVETIEKRVPGGYQTIGCNTGPPNGSGSQADGGGVWRRIRPDSAVVYIARPRYPEG